jgi:20S proteasome alpha/beta subunit
MLFSSSPRLIFLLILRQPAGSLQAWKACAVGANASAASDALAKSQEEADSKAKMVKSGTKGERAADDGGEEVVTSLISRAIQALSRASQESGVSKMNAADLCVQIYGADGCRMYTDEQLQVFLDSMTPHQGSAAD